MAQRESSLLWSFERGQGLLSRSCRKRMASIAMMGYLVFFSRAVAQRMGFLSSYDGELREPLVWPQGSPVSI